MKRLLLLGISMLISNILFSQTIVFSETFESYPLGSHYTSTFDTVWNLSSKSYVDHPDNDILYEDAEHGQVFRFGLAANTTGSNGSFQEKINLAGNYAELWLSMDVKMNEDFNPSEGGKWAGGVTMRNVNPIPWVVDSSFWGSGAAYFSVWQGGQCYVLYSQDHNLPMPWFQYAWGKDVCGININDFAGQWHNLTQRFVINTPGKADGYREIYLDGVFMDRLEGLIYRTAQQKDHFINYLYLMFFFGGTTPSVTASQEYLDNIVAYFYEPENEDFLEGKSPENNTISIVRPEYDLYPPPVIFDSVYTSPSDTIWGVSHGQTAPEHQNSITEIIVPGVKSVLLDFSIEGFGIYKDIGYKPNESYVLVYKGTGENKQLLKRFDRTDPPDESDHQMLVNDSSMTIEYFSINDWNKGWLASYSSNDGSKKTLDITINGEGEITPAEGFYPTDTIVTLIARPSHLWRFEGWFGDTIGTVVSDTSITVTMDSDKIIIAKFSPDESAQTPYGGTPKAIPGKIMVVDFDEGGEGIAYHDIDAQNRGGAYRPNEGVDIHEAAEHADNNYFLGWFKDGEWMEYTTDIIEGVYDIHVRIGNQNDERKLKILLNDSLLTTVDIPNTGSYTTWETATINGIFIPGGENKTLRLQNVNNDFDMSWIEFTAATSSQKMEKSLEILYPNPVKGELVLNNLLVHNKIKIYNLSGIQLFEKKVTSQTEVIDLSFFKSGFYLIQIEDSFSFKEKKVYKIVKE